MQDNVIFILHILYWPKFEPKKQIIKWDKEQE